MSGSSHHGVPEDHNNVSHEMPDDSGGWYFSRKEIEENSPSRKDGIDLKKEAYLRKSYCTFLQDLGMRLKVPQVTIATAIIFCHRFFLRQSHAKNDRRTIAIVCMFLAGKVEETPRPLKDVILVSYEIIHKKDPAAVQKIKQKDVYEKQKELILLGEKVVLVTLGFDLNVLQPYKPLVEAIKKFKVAQNALAQVAWNFVNDGLRTSLCLQFKPHHIAAGAIFLAAKFLKVKLPHEVWGQEFDVTPLQLEEVSNQMLELYEQSKAAPSQASEAEGSAGNSQRLQSKGQPNVEAASSLGDTAVKPSSSSSKPEASRGQLADHTGLPRPSQTRSSDRGSCDRGDYEIRDKHKEHESTTCQVNSGVVEGNPSFATDGLQAEADHQKGVAVHSEARDALEAKDKSNIRTVSTKAGGAVGQSPQSANKKLDLEKVISLKAAMERRKAQGDFAHKADPEDEIERELENVEMPAQNEKSRSDRKQNWSNSSSRPGHDGVRSNHVVKSQTPPHGGNNIVEEGELEAVDDANRGYQSPRSSSSSRKRKPESPRGEYGHALPKQNSHDRGVLGRHEYQERENKRRLQENRV